jgi:AcrR family transcriptional regulator
MESDLKAQLKKKPVHKLAGPDRRRQLVSIAMDLIAAKGFEGLRFQEVAQLAGINNATLFYHFSSKEELIMGVVEHLSRELQRTPGRAMDKPVTALEELRLEFDSMGNLLRRRPKLFLVLTELSMRSMRDPAMEKVTRIFDSSWRQHLSRMIALGIEEKAFCQDIDVDAAVLSLMAQIKGIGFHAVTARLKPGEVKQAIDQVASQVEHWLKNWRK